jgi:WD40 repeat protein
MSFCTNCGRQKGGSERYCTACGAPLPETVTSQPRAPREPGAWPPVAGADSGPGTITAGDSVNEPVGMAPAREQPRASGISRNAVIAITVSSVALAASGGIAAWLAFGNHSKASVPQGQSARSVSAGPSAQPSNTLASQSAQPTGSGTSSASPGVTGIPRSARYQLVGRLNPHAVGSVSAVAWNPAGTLVATGDKNGSTYLWDVATMRMADPPLSGPDTTYAAAFSPDGTLLATGYLDGTTYLWDVTTGRLIAKLPDPGRQAGKQVDSVAFSPDGTTLATSDGNGYTNLWSIPAGRGLVTLLASLRDPAGAGVYSAVFSSQGALATGDYSGNVYIWDIAVRATVATFAIPPSDCAGTLCGAISALAFSSDGSVLAAANESGTAELYGIASRVSNPLDVPSPAAGQAIWGMSFAGSGLLAMADQDGQSYLWQVTDASLTASLAVVLPDPGSGHDGVGTLAFSPDGTSLVTGDTNGSAYLWRIS